MNRESDGGSSTGEKKSLGGEGERARPVLHLSTHLIAALSGAIAVSAGLEGVQPLDRVDVIGVMISPFCDLPVAQRMVDDVRVMAIEAGADDSGALLLSVLLEEAELLHFAASIGELHLLLSNREARLSGLGGLGDSNGGGRAWQGRGRS